MTVSGCMVCVSVLQAGANACHGSFVAMPNQTDAGASVAMHVAVHTDEGLATTTWPPRQLER